MADTTNANLIPITQAVVVYSPTGIPLAVSSTPSAVGPGTAATAGRTVEAGAPTGTQSIVAGSATNVTILAANAGRRGAAIYNDSSALLYLLVGTGTSSTTVFTVKMAAEGYYEVPADYTGIIAGIWASATGSARVTEWT